MPKDKPWLKLWSEWLGDAKMDRLSLAEQGAWWRLLTLCHECGHLDENGVLDGALIVAGVPLTLAEIMKSLKISDEPDKAVFNQMCDKMSTAGSLCWKDGTLYVVHYEERQRAATDTKEARRQRQRDRRAKLREQEEKREPEKRTPPPDEDGEEERKEAEEETHAQNGHANSVTKELSRCYEAYIGVLNPPDAERMREFTDYYVGHGGQVDWLEEGFKKAPVSKRRWPYVQAILERYVEQGGPDGREGEGQAGRRAAADRGAAAERGQRDPLDASRQAGWRVKRSGPG